MFSRAEESRRKFVEKLAAAVEAGGCPKCAWMQTIVVLEKHHPDGKLRQCSNCGNRFEIPKEKE